MGARVPTNEETRMMATIFDLKSLTLSQFMHVKPVQTGYQQMENKVNDMDIYFILYYIFSR